MQKYMTVVRRQAECPIGKTAVDDCLECEHCLPVLSEGAHLTIEECVSDCPPDEQYILCYLCDQLPGGGHGGLAGVRESAPVYPPRLCNTRIYLDGNQWCCIRGLDIQSGVVGFGDTPEEAVEAFEQAWTDSGRQR